ncbi:hypothetical protein DdX_13538 [Ditylenchus destructor]|uniref:Uncharacterized protein n=1 Tax=Ditylenchus destructor TaxID=166010 RepID=A0AAD4MYQ7_9BILA|nr:hypothetical protein DdX_13538 [Ditylenchus destructor]
MYHIFSVTYFVPENFGDKIRSQSQNSSGRRPRGSADKATVDAALLPNNPTLTADGGITWSTVETWNTEIQAPEPHNRIDFIFYKGSRLTPVRSETMPFANGTWSSCDKHCQCGITWSTVETWNTEIQAPEPHNRIDFIFYKGSRLTPVRSETMPFANGTWSSCDKHCQCGETCDAVKNNVHPSDHFLVYTDFEWR